MNGVAANGWSNCPPSIILEHFVAGALTADDEERVGRHLEGCPVCAAKLAKDDGDSELERLLRAPSESPVVSLQEADEILEKVKRPKKAGAAGRRADRRFRFTEQEIAKGGMGIIHKGVDTEIGRTVAVKRLNDEHAADRRHIKQFEHEARVTGLLEHPGIVPVYGRGKDAGGRPFYAMRMVEGEPLTAAVKRLREAPRGNAKALELRRLLSRFVTVCNTVAYAHTRGFVHLDLKPSNILLGAFGETFTMDWGLVMKVDRPVPRSSGTACFMSPEQLEGRFDKVGPASDIYALGGVLYTIVTGLRPSSDTDTVARGEATGIPKPLYAILLKAMDHEPERRYNSPLALAADVERWLADEPVSVLPESLVDRAARWVRRHRSATLAAMVTLATVTVAATVATVVVSLARTGERQALARAEARTDVAVEAVRKFHEAVNDNLDVRNRPDLSGLRKKLLAEPLKFFEQLRQDLQKGGDIRPATNLKVAKASLELAGLLDEIGSKPDAVRSYQGAIATLGPFEVFESRTGDQARQKGRTVLANALGRLGTMQRDLGKVDEARTCLKRALGISARLVHESSAPLERVIHADLLRRLAMIEAPEFPDKAISLLEEAVAELQPIASDRLILPVNPDLLAMIYTNLGSALRARRRMSEAAERFRDSIAAYEVLVRDSPGNHSFRNNLAAACFNLANLRLNSNNGENVQAGFERARDLWEDLAREFPSSSYYRSFLVAAYGMLGVLHENAARFEGARAALNRSREIGESLVRDHPSVLKYRSDLGKTLINLSGLETMAGQTGASVALLEVAREHLREVFHKRPGDRSARDAFGTACAGLANELVAADRHAEALEVFRECASLELDLMRANDSQFMPNHPHLASGLLGMARCHLYLGRVAEAATVTEEWRSLWIGDPTEPRLVTQELAQCSVSSHDTAVAKRYADWAMDLLRQAVAAGFRNTKWLRTNPEIAPLRTRADFRDLLGDASFPRDPFAR